MEITNLINDIEKVYVLVTRGERSFEIDVHSLGKGLSCLNEVAFVRLMVSWLTLATDLSLCKVDGILAYTRNIS